MFFIVRSSDLGESLEDENTFFFHTLIKQMLVHDTKIIPVKIKQLKKLNHTSNLIPLIIDWAS